MRWSKNTRHLLVFQNKALPLQSNRKSTPQDTAKYGKNPVEQQREITSLAKRYIKDIQPLIVRLRFLVAPLFKKEKRCKSLNFKEVRGFFFPKNRQNKWDQSKLTSLFKGLVLKARNVPPRGVYFILLQHVALFYITGFSVRFPNFVSLKIEPYGKKKIQRVVLHQAQQTVKKRGSTRACACHL